MIDIGKIIHLVETAVNITPEFLKLGDEVVKMVKGKDQKALQTALADARKRSDSLHNQIQSEVK
jgi:hypothetical protein